MWGEENRDPPVQEHNAVRITEEYGACITNKLQDLSRSYRESADRLAADIMWRPWPGWW